MYKQNFAIRTMRNQKANDYYRVLVHDQEAPRGPGCVTDPVQRANARSGPAFGAVRPQVPSAAVALLRGHGLSDRAIAEVGAVGAMFAWANRLVTGLGEPTD